MKNHLKTSLGVLFAVGGICFPVLANAKEVPFPQCPKTLAIQQKIDTPMSEGWKLVYRDSSVPLKGYWIAAGEYPVKQRGFEIPSEEKKLSNGDVIVYHDDLLPPTGGQHDYWAVCQYHNTSAVLVQKIPENTIRCEIKILNNHLAEDRETIKCFDTPRKTRR